MKDSPTAKAESARRLMEQSFDYDAKEIFFAMWAKMVGVDWDDLNKEERRFVMTRLNYAWYRAVGL